ncbi:MAG: hypothetical protein AAFQ89_19360 [Cyanobacteria bacterium J06626_18]
MDELYSILQAATHEERENLAALTGSAFGSAPETLCNHPKFLRAGSIGQIFWNASWKQLVTDVADHVGIDWLATLDDHSWSDLPTADIEAAIVLQVFQDIFDTLSPQQRQELLMSMERDIDDPDLATLIGSGGAMTAAKLSGFGVYFLASTTLGSLTSALGITLPFAVYMGMSQTIALILGPIGWTALGGGLLWAINQPNWHRLVLAVIFIIALRYPR